VAEGVTYANVGLSLWFRQDPGFRLDDPYTDALHDSLPITVEERGVGCTATSCIWEQFLAQAQQGVDSCFLTGLGGAFGSAQDQNMTESGDFGHRISSFSSVADFGVSPATGPWNSVPIGWMSCRAGGHPRVYQAEVSVDGSGLLEQPLSEPATGRVCSIAGVRGDLNNGDEVNVFPTIDGWQLRIFSNFSNQAGLLATVVCQDGEVLETVAVQNDEEVRYLAPEDICVLTRVRNDFAGIDERVKATRIGSQVIDPDLVTWALIATSNRPFDPGGQVEGTFVCFEPR